MMGLVFETGSFVLALKVQVNQRNIAASVDVVDQVPGFATRSANGSENGFQPRARFYPGFHQRLPALHPLDFLRARFGGGSSPSFRDFPHSCKMKAGRKSQLPRPARAADLSPEWSWFLAEATADSGGKQVSAGGDRYRVKSTSRILILLASEALPAISAES